MIIENVILIYYGEDISLPSRWGKNPMEDGARYEAFYFRNTPLEGFIEAVICRNEFYREYIKLKRCLT